MNEQANIKEFRQLDAEIAESEADVEAKKWRQAELAAEAVADGMTQTAYAEAVNKTRATISIFVRVWERFGVIPGRPRFVDAYNTVRVGGEEIVTKAETRRRETERMEPTRHEDRVEMAEKLLADPKVAKQVASTVTNPSTRAGRLIAQQVYDHDAAARRKRAEAEQQSREDRALPLPAHMATMVTKMNEWGLTLAGLHDDLDELPEGRGRELVAIAAANLAEQAQRWVDRLERRPDLQVIEGQLSVIDVA